MKAPRGFMIVAALFLVLILLIMSLAFLSKKVLQYRGAVLLKHSALARALAEAGLEDARVKLERDLAFPPPGGEDQEVFSYTEDVYDGTTRLGSSTVTVDTTWETTPYAVIRITSRGIAGPAEDPLAVRELVAELDVAPDTGRTLPHPQIVYRERPSKPLENWFADPKDASGDPTTVNPNYFRYLLWVDRGNP